MRTASLGERDGIAVFQKDKVDALYVDGSRPIVGQANDLANANIIRHL
jgi:hypothetical protein